MMIKLKKSPKLPRKSPKIPRKVRKGGYFSIKKSFRRYFGYTPLVIESKLGFELNSILDSVLSDLFFSIIDFVGQIQDRLTFVSYDSTSTEGPILWSTEH